MTTAGRSDARGFTLVELMVTVAIIAVLAFLAAIGYARWARAAKTGEATATLGNIKASQDSYRSEVQKFLDCGGLGTSYPTRGGSGDQKIPGPNKHPFDTSACGATTGPCAAFRRLNTQTESLVYFTYSCQAGPADNSNVTGYNGRIWGKATDVWYIVRANGDLDGNGTESNYESSSFDSSIWVVNGDE
jgi:prepilin-type N-terminal cleavage/methylation domain-containing protein